MLSLGSPLAHSSTVVKQKTRRPSISRRMFATANRVSVPLEKEAVHKSVENYYGVVLKTSEDLKTSACCTPTAPAKEIRDIIRNLPDEVKSKYYGCGSPLPMGIKGMRVLDLGSGSGRDCYVAATLVGESGSVTGIDMTDSQLDVARRHVLDYTSKIGYASPNMAFVKGNIEDLSAAGIEDSSVDLVISNCVINLSPDKEAVLREVHRVLAHGGEFYFSDVYCDRRLPTHVAQDEVMLGECLGGALYVEDFKRMCQKVGFPDPRVLSSHTIDIKDEAIKELVGEAKFYSITYRLFKFPEGVIETLCEDYGQFATYLGTIPGSPHAYDLDDHHHFVTNKPMLVCGNTGSMVGESWLQSHVKLVGDRSTHFGLFDCAPKPGSDSQGSGGATSCC